MTKIKSEQTDIVLLEADVRDHIFQICGLNVMLARDLAALYAVETKQLNTQIGRTVERFLNDFMCELTVEEYRILRSQFGALKQGEY